MSGNVEIGEPLSALLRQTDHSAQRTGREMIVHELYQRGTISSAKAADVRPKRR